jgi:hypothetical protein
LRPQEKWKEAMMANVPTPAQLDTLRRYLLESGGGVTLQHLQVLRQLLRDPLISEYELMECAKVLLLDNDNDWEGEDFNTKKWLNSISFDLRQMED